jgi:hypothetical protein
MSTRIGFAAAGAARSDELPGNSDEAHKWRFPYVSGPGNVIRREVLVWTELAVEV